MGNTLPSLAASGSRIITFVIPAVWLTTQPGFEVYQLWYVSVATVALQAVLAWALMAREMKSRLHPAGPWS